MFWLTKPSSMDHITMTRYGQTRVSLISTSADQLATTGQHWHTYHLCAHFTDDWVHACKGTELSGVEDMTHDTDTSIGNELAGNSTANMDDHS